MVPRDFWADSDEFTNPAPVTDAMVAEAERALRYKLPRAYLDLIKTRNGGTPRRNCFPTATPTSWAEDHIRIDGVCGLGGRWGIDGKLGSRYLIQEWGYPPIGVLFGQCPSAGHDAVFFDYTECGPEREPRVVHIEVEAGEEPQVTFLARDFASFVSGLVSSEAFDGEADAALLELNRWHVTHGDFSPLLRELCEGSGDPLGAENALRALARRIVRQKGEFVLRDDPLSELLYDLQFWLYTHAREVGTARDYLAAYPQMLFVGSGGFATEDFAPRWVKQWFRRRREMGAIRSRGGRLGYTEDYVIQLRARVRRVVSDDGEPLPEREPFQL